MNKSNIYEKWIIGDSNEKRNILYDTIACTAANMITEDSTVYINTGNTGNMMVKYLPEFHFTLVTNSIIIAKSVFENYKNIDVIVLGGKLRIRGVCDKFDDSNFISDQISNFKFDFSFLAGEGVTIKDGLTNSSYNTSFLQQCIANNTKVNIALLPYFKINTIGSFKVIDIEKLNYIITNKYVNQDIISEFQNTDFLNIITV